MSSFFIFFVGIALISLGVKKRGKWHREMKIHNYVIAGYEEDCEFIELKEYMGDGSEIFEMNEWRIRIMLALHTLVFLIGYALVVFASMLFVKDYGAW